MKKILFNSSLPRAWSTLFQNIVSDNPEFYCTPTSPLAGYVLGAKNTHANSQAVKAQDQESMKKAFLGFCRLGMQGYFNNLTDKKLILDKSRDWGINYDLLNMINKDVKVICMIRDPRAIYASMEKNFRKNPDKQNHIQDPSKMKGTTLAKRIDLWANGIPVGIALDRLKDIIDQGLDKKILFIRYEDLMDFPEKEMRKFYKYIGMPYYEGHQYKTVTQHTHEDDKFHGIYGDHVLRKKFERKPDDFNEVLGYEISNKIKNNYAWFFKKFGYV